MPSKPEHHAALHGVDEALLQPFLFQKARRLLPVTVKSDTGLSEGEIWFLDEAGLTFWCVETLRPGRRYEMRADVKTLGRNVDLIVEIESAMAGRDAAVPTGYLHQGTYSAGTPHDHQRLLKRFWQLNPEYAPQEEAPPPARDPQRSPDAAHGPQRRPESADPDRRPREGSPQRAPGRDDASRRPARKAPQPRRRSQVVPETIPPPPLPRSQRPSPDLAPGDPPTILVRYTHREVLQADALLRGEVFWLYTGRHPLLWEGQEVRMMLQIPAGNILELRCVVAAERPDCSVLVARHLHASLITNLRTALGC